jgi:hypothetical protein
MAFYPCVLSWVDTVSDEVNLFPDTCTFKLKAGTTAAGPYSCRVSKHTSTSGDEAMMGGKVTAMELYDLFLPPHTIVQPFWRVEVTIAGEASPITYAVKDAGSGVSDEVSRRVVIERVR